MAQVVIEGKRLSFSNEDKKTSVSAGGFSAQGRSGGESFSLRRNFAFALFSGFYLGGFQHFLYNVVFTRLFGAGQSLKVALQKVAADLFVTTPFICHPVYYSSEYAILKGEPAEGLRTYFVGKPGGSPEFLPVMSRYAMIWPAFHLFNFTITPPELRIAGIACVSFVWLTILSNVSHKELDVEEE